MFSVLLPTRNRLELLRYAIESVLRQDCDDWEVVVSDNDSTEDICGYVASLQDARVRCIRTDRFVPVTENWNNALAHSGGDYVVMLGDDDCLLPGYFSTLSALIAQFSSPEAVYAEAVQFAYPGVIPGHAEGFVQTGYSELFRGREQPFLLDRSEALAAVRKSMSLRLSFSYNMQHSLVSRRFLESLRPHGAFFQSPYPDYYATNVMLLAGRAILVVPQPLVAIGISPKSFGFYYFNNRSDEGTAFLNNLDLTATPESVRARLLPGDPLLTSWFVAMSCIERNFGAEYAISADVDRYRFLQLLYAAKGRRPLRLASYWAALNWSERLRFYARLGLAYLFSALLPRNIRARYVRRYMNRVSPFPSFDPQIRTVDCKNILDLFELYSVAR